MSRRVRQVRRPQIEREPSLAPRQPKARHSPKPSRSLLRLVAIFILLVVGWFGGQIGSIEIKSSRSPQALESLIRRDLAAPPWKRHILGFRTAQLEDDLKAAYPEVIADIKISKNWLHRALEVQVDEYRPVVAWRTGSTTYGLDQRGIVANRGEGSLEKLPLVIDKTNLEVKPGQAIVPGRFVEFVSALSLRLPKIEDLEFKAAEVVETTNELRVDTGRGYYLRLDTTRGLEDQLATLRVLLRRHVRPEQYIDLRLPYKVYYR